MPPGRVLVVNTGSSSLELRILDPSDTVVDLDPTGNRRTRNGDADITAEGAPVSTLALAAREDLEMARQIRGALGDGPWR